MVKLIESMEDFAAAKASPKLVVIDFFAEWCGPCKMIAPMFEQWVTEYPDIDFYKVDVDDAEDVTAACGIQAMPTFLFFKGGEMVHNIQGANISALQAAFAKLK